MKNSLLALFLTAAPLLAQFDTAEVLGTVRDHSGSVVPKASITLVNEGTGIQAKTIGGKLGAVVSVESSGGGIDRGRVRDLYHSVTLRVHFALAEE